MSERDYDVLLALSTKKQSAYGTALVDGSLTKSYPANSLAILEEELGHETNENMIGIGEWATEQYEELHDCRLPLKYDCGSWILAWVVAFGLGACSSAQQGGTAAYKHTSVPYTTDKQLPQTTIVERQTSGIKNKIRDIIVSRFKLSGEQGKRLQLEFDLQGSGHVATSTLSMPTLTADSFLRMHGVTFDVGVADSEVDVSERLKRFELEWNNNLLLADGYHPGSGQVRGRCEHGRRTLSVAFDLLMDNATTERTHWLANQALKAIITMQGALIESTYYHGSVITVPKLKYTKLPVGAEDNLMRYSAETNVLYDSATGYLVQFETTNTEAAFLDSEA